MSGHLRKYAPATASATSTSYDDVPYESYPFAPVVENAIGVEIIRCPGDTSRKIALAVDEALRELAQKAC